MAGRDDPLGRDQGPAAGATAVATVLVGRKLALQVRGGSYRVFVLTNTAHGAISTGWL